MTSIGTYGRIFLRYLKQSRIEIKCNAADQQIYETMNANIYTRSKSLTVFSVLN